MVSENRNELIENNIGLVHSVASRFKNRGAEYEDIFQAGCVGLIKAADRFDESLGYRFSTYAVPVIMGEIRRIFRDGGQIKISRSLKEKSFSVQCIRDKFIKTENREPTVSELSSLSGYDVNELSEILNILAPVISLSFESDEAECELDIPVFEEERLFDRISVSTAISHLEPREKILVKLRYFDGKTQAETAAALGISQVQVSRKEKKILLKLKQYLS